MMSQRSILTFYFQVRGLVFLQRTVINDESSVHPCSKRPFSDVTEGVVPNISGASPRTPVFLLPCIDSFLCYLSYLSVQPGQ